VLRFVRVPDEVYEPIREMERIAGTAPEFDSERAGPFAATINS